VYNAGSRTTLISDFQVYDHRLVLDSISTKHRAHVDGNKGNQTFWISEDQILPLHLKGALMTFTFSKPSWDELKTMEVIDITTEIPRHPIIHSDDPFALSSINGRGLQGSAERPTLHKNENHARGPRSVYPCAYILYSSAVITFTLLA
jgi:hypothetical protein